MIRVSLFTGFAIVFFVDMITFDLLQEISRQIIGNVVLRPHEMDDLAVELIDLVH